MNTLKNKADKTQDRFYYIELYDFYKNLFTDKQQAYFEANYFQDCSLSEIAEEYQVSRAAVYDAILKIQKELVNYEEKLGLWAKHNQRLKLINQIKDEKLKQEFQVLEDK